MKLDDTSDKLSQGENEDCKYEKHNLRSKVYGNKFCGKDNVEEGLEGFAATVLEFADEHSMTPKFHNL